MMRTGIGFDVHRLVEERKLVLGGVVISHKKGLLGHSDADVLVHAIMDALLGACAMGDIGKLFPDSDPTYRDCNSLMLLAEVWKRIEGNGYSLVNLDSVIMAEKPKLSPFIDEMRKNIAETIACEVDRISIKATTTEKLGFTGREEGIAAEAIVLIETK